MNSLFLRKHICIIMTTEFIHLVVAALYMPVFMYLGVIFKSDNCGKYRGFFSPFLGCMEKTSCVVMKVNYSQAICYITLIQTKLKL